MKILDFLGNTLGLKEDPGCFFDGYNSSLITNNAYQALAVKASINLIAKTISRTEFQTFEKGKATKKKTYYMLNVEANKNTSAPAFWRSVVTKLLENGETLVLIENGELLLIDSFERKEFAFKENLYTNMYIGDYKLREQANESEVLYLQDTVTSLAGNLNKITSELAQLISASNKGYNRSKSRKGTLNIPANLSKTKEQQEATQKHIDSIMKDFMDPSKDSVLPETNGMAYTEIDEAKGSKSNDSGRETKNFIGDIFDFVAIAFGIPPSLLKGDTVDTKDAVNNFLAFCINPLVGIIQAEINRKMYGYEHYSNKTYSKIDTTKIKSVDLRDIANSIDLLVRNGAFTIDDTLKTLGLEAVGGDVGGLRVMTRNNESIETFMKGGD